MFLKLMMMFLLIQSTSLPTSQGNVYAWYLSGYTYVTDYIVAHPECPPFHFSFLRFGFDQKSNFLLCMVVDGYRPRRNKLHRNFVSEEEYEEGDHFTSFPHMISRLTGTVAKILTN